MQLHPCPRFSATKKYIAWNGWHYSKQTTKVLHIQKFLLLGGQALPTTPRRSSSHSVEKCNYKLLLVWFFLQYFILYEWMNEWCIYIALFVYCCTPKALYNHVGGGVSPQPPPVCSIHLDDATAATGQWRQCTHHTPATDGERVIEPIKWMGIIRRPWLTRASGGNLARTPGLHPTLYEKCHGIFNDHRESGPRFNVSSERRCLLTV